MALRKRTVAAAAALAAAAYLSFWPISLEPVAFAAPEDPGRSGPHLENRSLSAAERLVEGIGRGPEDVTIGPDGLAYTGLEDGRVMRFRLDGAGLEEFANTGGRPLGLLFDAAGELVVADARRGLLRITGAGEVRVLADAVDGVPMRFVDDLDIAADGTIWFSDASQRHGIDDYLLDFWEMQPTGRLLTWDPRTEEVEVRLDDLYFANGVALGPDDAFVVVCETSAARITRLWLTGPKAGTNEVFADALPGYPDNVSFDHRGTFWVALPAPRQGSIEWLWPRPGIRSAVLRLPSWLTDPRPADAYGWVLGLDGDGSVRFDLQDPTGEAGSVTGVTAHGGSLYLGGLEMEWVARVRDPSG